MMERTTIEQQIFTWEEWDEMDVTDLQFYNVTLIVPVGQFPVGTKFPLAFMLVSESILSLVDEDKNVYDFSLILTVGEQVPAGERACECGHDHGGPYTHQ